MEVISFDTMAENKEGIMNQENRDIVMWLFIAIMAIVWASGIVAFIRSMLH